MVYALGLGDCLEGVTAECDFPADAKGKPVVCTSSLPPLDGLAPADIDRLVGESVARDTPLYTLDTEAIQKISPDLILAQDLCRVCAVPSGQVVEALAHLGCSARVLSLDPHSLGEIVEGLRQLGREADRSKLADNLAEELYGRIEAVRLAAAGRDKPSVLALEWADPPFPGGHWIPEMINIAGGHPVLGTARQPSTRLTWPQIAQAAPEVIVFMPCGYSLEDAEDQAADLYKVPEFASTPAARQNRVFVTDGSAYFSRPGPRIVEGLEILAWALHPDAFSNPGGNKSASS